MPEQGTHEEERREESNLQNLLTAAVHLCCSDIAFGDRDRNLDLDLSAVPNARPPLTRAPVDSNNGTGKDNTE